MIPPPQTPKEYLGAALYWTGIFGFPAAVGSAVGFYVADQGFRWLPDMISGILGVCLISLLLIIVGRGLRGGLFRQTPMGLTLSRRVIAAAGLLSVALIGRLSVYAMEQPSALTEMDPDTLERAMAVDLVRYRELDAALEELLARLEQDPRFTSKEDAVLSPEQERLLLDTYRAVYDQAFALDQIREFHEDWYRFDPSRAERPHHLRSFLLSYAAELSLYEKTARFVSLVLRNTDAKRFLDVPHPEYGFEESSFSRLRQELVDAGEQSRIVAGRGYQEFLEETLRGRQEAEMLGVGWLWKNTESLYASLLRMGLIQQAELSARSEVQSLKRVVNRSWYPAQKSVAEWFGDTRTRRVGWYLITPAQIEEMDPHLTPGDILLSRKNWYLSNVGLPGFWPHALLYIGDPEKLSAEMDTPEIRAWVKAETGEEMGLGEYLARRFPSAWQRYQEGIDGHHHRVIEAISEGVVFNSLEHAAGDYLAAMRPAKLSKLDKARAIVRAFNHLEKPYDYNFDFATDHALVCTELVWRSYRPAEGEPGVDLALVDVAGRRTLPANDLARQFSEMQFTEDPELSFVYFLDAREKEGRAVVGTREDFISSYKRVKWDVAQK